MSGEFEAAGAMATAGLAASAIEGREGRLAGDGACLNCGAGLEGPFCAQCGQAAHPHRSLWHMAEEVLHGLFHFDTKAWRTLPMVLFRPGTLTRNYVYGQRVRYVSPLATFLLCVFFMFFVFSLLPAPVQENGPEASADAREQLDEARAGLREAEQELAQLRRTLASPDADAGDRAEEPVLRRVLSEAQQQVRRRERALAQAQATEAALRVPADEADPAATAVPTSPPPLATAPAPAEAETQAAPNPYPGGTLEYGLYQLSQGNIHIFDNPTLSAKVREKLSNPPLLLYRLQETAYKFSFILVPLSLPFIALLFLWKRGVTLYDHTVFALYSLCFASLLFVVLVTTGQLAWLSWLPATLVAFGLPLHTFFHLKGAYGLGWFSALWRALFMLVFATIALALYLALILIVGFIE